MDLARGDCKLATFCKGSALLLACFIGLVPCRCWSQAATRVFIQADFQPVAALGLVIPLSGDPSKHEARISSPGDGQYTVSFNPPVVSGEAMVTALLESEDGHLAFGAVRPIELPDPRQSLFDTPECPAPPAPANPNPEQLGLIFKLVEVRSARRELVQIKIAKIMEGTFLQKIRKLENGLGLSRDVELGPTMNSMELLNRLAILTIAVKNYEINKERAG